MPSGYNRSLLLWLPLNEVPFPVKPILLAMLSKVAKAGRRDKQIRCIIAVMDQTSSDGVSRARTLQSGLSFSPLFFKSERYPTIRASKSRGRISSILRKHFLHIRENERISVFALF